MPGDIRHTKLNHGQVNKKSPAALLIIVMNVFNLVPQEVSELIISFIPDPNNLEIVDKTTRNVYHEYLLRHYTRENEMNAITNYRMTNAPSSDYRTYVKNISFVEELLLKDNGDIGMFSHIHSSLVEKSTDIFGPAVGIICLTRLFNTLCSRLFSAEKMISWAYNGLEKLVSVGSIDELNLFDEFNNVLINFGIDNEVIAESIRNKYFKKNYQ